MTLRIRKLATTLGAEISGIDLADVLEPETARTIAEAWASCGVLVFPGQAISDEHHVGFARHFGKLGVFRRRAGGDDGDTVLEIFRASNADPAGNLIRADGEEAKLIRLNWFWHTDSCYRSIPDQGVILRGIEVIDDGGGDTIFADLVAAYEALPAATRRRLAGLVARHSFEHLITSFDLPPLRPEELAELPAVEHPLVRQHADGRRSLFLSPPYMERIVGWNRAESLALIEELAEWATQERFLYRHRWRPHDVLMWDNGWMMHKVTPYDVARGRRVMHGAVILGTEPIRPVTAMA